MKGWLLGTNVVTELGGRLRDPKVAAWAADLADHTLYISVLTLAEYDKGIHNLAIGSPARARIEAAVAAIELDFARRTLRDRASLGPPEWHGSANNRQGAAGRRHRACGHGDRA